jgi:hypothetical protein
MSDPPTFDLAAEAGLAAAEDVDRRPDGSDVDERDAARLPFLALAPGEAAELPGVREREEVDVDRGRRQALLLQELDPLLDRLLLARREECRHLLAALAVGVGGRARGRALQRLAIEDDLLELERQVLVRLQADRLLEVALGHLGHRHVAHDDRLSEHAGHDLPALELALVEDALDGIGRRASGGDLRAGEARDDGLLTLHRDLDGLDDGASEVESDDALVLAEHGMPCSSFAVEIRRRRSLGAAARGIRQPATPSAWKRVGV